MQKVIFFTTIAFILFTGCASKEVKIIEKPVYIKSKCPELHKIEVKKDFSFGKAYNKGNKVCLLDWDNTCLPKEKFISLVKFMKDLKYTIIKYENMVDIYNKKDLGSGEVTKAHSNP